MSVSARPGTGAAFLAWSYLSTAIIHFGAKLASEYPTVMT